MRPPPSPSLHAPRRGRFRQLTRQVKTLKRTTKLLTHDLTALKRRNMILDEQAAQKDALTTRDFGVLLAYSVLLVIPVLLIAADLIGTSRRLHKLTNDGRAAAYKLADLKEIAGGTPGLARYSMAALIFLILGWAVGYLFLTGTNVPIARNILSTLVGLLAGIVGFYFGTRSKEGPPAPPATPPASAAKPDDAATNPSTT
jgi:hypothetical protein